MSTDVFSAPQPLPRSSRSRPTPRKRPAAPQAAPTTSPGRLLVADPAGDVVCFPLHPDGPQRFREASAEETWLWLRQGAVVAGGGLWTEEMAQQGRAEYRQQVGATDSQTTKVQTTKVQTTKVQTTDAQTTDAQTTKARTTNTLQEVPCV